ncbi:MAG: IclR family transcriptional regulator [Spirochaetia bacterium]|nr:IclR family transcriptional regulator [Spirochaetia bacterium]
MQSEGVKKNQSIGKALLIIEHMAKQQRPQRLLDLANDLKMPSSTIIRFLNTLIEYGYVRRDPENSRYSLTLKLTSLGNLAYSKFSYSNALKSHLHSISDTLNESASLSIEQDMNVVYIDTAEGPDHILQTLQRIGKVAPMHSTGAGKILMMNYNEAEINRYIDIRGLPGYTEKTLVTRHSFLKEMEKVRTQGFAYDDEECEIGVKCIAFPVRDFSGKVVASISVSAPISRMAPPREEEIIEVLKEVTQQASLDLGWAEG